MTRHIGLLLTSMVLAVTGCEDETLSCTLIGCTDRARVAIVAPADVWPNGEYVLDIRLAGEHRCTFALPVPGVVSGPASIQPVPISCSPAVPGGSAQRGAVAFRQLTGGPGCGPVDASLGCDVETYRIDIDADDVAVDVDVRLAVGETVLLDRTESFEYRSFWPNGPECASCRSANVQMVLSQP